VRIIGGGFPLLSFIHNNMKKAAFTFGRMNPPHIGHELVVEAVRKAGGKNSFLFTSQSTDPKKNPLNYRKKATYLRKMFGKRIKVISDAKIRDVHGALEYLSDNGFTHLRMVVGSDQVEGFKKAVLPYVDDYGIEFFEVVSAGTRDPDASDVSGMSASKLRKIVAAGDFDAFQVGMPRSISEKDQKKLYNDLRSGMGLSEDTESYWFDYEEFSIFEKMYDLTEDQDLLKQVTNFIGE